MLADHDEHRDRLERREDAGAVVGANVGRNAAIVSSVIGACIRAMAACAAPDDVPARTRRAR